MQDTQNSNSIRHYHVGCNVGGPRDNKLSSSGNPARAAAFRKIKQTTYRADDLLVNVTAAPGFFLSM